VTADCTAGNRSGYETRQMCMLIAHLFTLVTLVTSVIVGGLSKVKEKSFYQEQCNLTHTVRGWLKCVWYTSSLDPQISWSLYPLVHSLVLFSSIR
jgi:hypothetical protein